jgi:hypothetical protein
MKSGKSIKFIAAFSVLGLLIFIFQNCANIDSGGSNGLCKPKLDLSKGIEITLPHANNSIAGGGSASIGFSDLSVGTFVMNFDPSIQGQESLPNFQAKFKEVVGNIMTSNYLSCPANSLSDLSGSSNPQIQFESYSNKTLKGTYTVDLKSAIYWKSNSKDPNCRSDDMLGTCPVETPFVTKVTIHFDISI